MSDGVAASASSDEPMVVVRRHGRVAEVSLSRVAAHNALSSAMMTELAGRLGELAGDDVVRAVVLSSAAPTVFCVGADLKERARLDLDGFLAQRTVFRAAFDALRGLPMPTVAAVHGFALGGGYELALCCDLIVADDTAVVGLPEVSLGIVPGGGGTQLVARRCGAAVAADLLFTARRIAIDEARSLGLVDRRVLAGEARTAALELAAVIAGHAPVAVREAKAALRHALAGDLAAGLDAEDRAWRIAIAHPQRAEGVAAFVARRRPDWDATT
jgi:enoyl-CoA hydratase/carnithine racemase